MTHRSPDFIGIGVPKSGSTWFMRILKQHPDIFISDRKEPHFFSNEELYFGGLENYTKLFPKSSEGKIKGEFSTKYLSRADKVSKRIKKTFPNVKLICILRNPIDRANSHLNWLKQLGDINKNLTMREALKINNGMIKFSTYSEGIKTFLDDFPKENILFIKTEDLKNNPKEIFSKVCNFLKLKEFEFNFKGTSKSQTIIPRNSILEYMRKELHKKIRSLNQDWLFNTFLANYFSRLYRKFNSDKNIKVHLSDSEKEFLAEFFREDYKNLKKIINLDIKDWGEYLN